MTKSFLLENQTAVKLYKSASELPIIDFHCHLSPKEIYEDKEFDNIGEMWLGGDHYKWRLMRTAGIDEEYITGNTSWHDKFVKYASAIEFAAGNPLYHWSHMELSSVFGIDDAICAENAEDIWEKANDYISEKKLSPRKLIEEANVQVICTTDDIIDDLSWHKKIRQDKSFKTRVIPSFRTDNLLLMFKDGYKDYIVKLSECTGIEVKDLVSLKDAAADRLTYFVQNGCVFTDVGMPYFPANILDDAAADDVFKKILNKKDVTLEQYLGLVGNLYVFFGKLYKENNLVMQLHLAVIRNPNTVLFGKLGADCGVDCVGNVIDGKSLITILDAINKASGLPDTILYTLNNSNASQIASIAGSFPNVHCGAAWWFCDHKLGIKEQINVIAENSSIGEFYGMLTDSRSFLSYPRHDYFRRILCSVVGEWVESEEYNKDSAAKLIEKICYLNVKERVEK